MILKLLLGNNCDLKHFIMTYYCVRYNIMDNHIQLYHHQYAYCRIYHGKWNENELSIVIVDTAVNLETIAVWSLVIFQ